MTSQARHLAVLAVIAAGILPAAPVFAQPRPLYPYSEQQSQPYAVEVAPNTYVIQRPTRTRDYHCLNCRKSNSHPVAERFDRSHKPADRALVEELRERSQHKEKDADKEKEADINATKIAREPAAVENKRYVEDSPRAIKRQPAAHDQPVSLRHGRPVKEQDDETGRLGSSSNGKPYVIRAEAEITVLGPDRMSIRLFRKQRSPQAKAPAND